MLSLHLGIVNDHLQAPKKTCMNAKNSMNSLDCSQIAENHPDFVLKRRDTRDTQERTAPIGYHPVLNNFVE